jgi:hypothetical protein
MGFARSAVHPIGGTADSEADSVMVGGLRSRDLWLDPYPTFAALREEAPVYKFDDRAHVVLSGR